GATALAQVYRQLGDKPADVRDVAQLKGFYDAIQALVAQRKLLAYHDRSDGGLLVTLAEMAFTGHCGVEANIATLGEDRLAALFNEELGAVIQVRAADRDAVEAILAQHGLADCVHYLGKAVQGDRFVIEADGHAVFSESRTTLRMWWAETTWQMQRLRDNPECADQEHNAKANDQDPGLNVKLSFDINEDIAAPYIATGARPKVAVLREQGVNGEIEMAAAFTRAGFDAYDVHMSDLMAGRVHLADFKMLAACGGFSYGDVLGAGEGWAKSILFHPALRDQFAAFFADPDTLTLGVCNGCQMVSNLAEIIPGAAGWPKFKRNLSEQFEARLSMVHVPKSASLILNEMQGSSLPVVVSHGEGRADFALHGGKISDGLGIALQYVDGQNQVTQTYPLNPNGSPQGIAGVTNADGRVTIMMPHPERVYRAAQMSWKPEDWTELSGWYRLFAGARKALG
ncbi:MAG: phosphoribosylformylglycinamidine synthase subunit PurQ, partial [Neisseria sp.]|nr:phosphoribosylformylglycinamidine synthase subunit PurQ [Neisseria sp.]